MGKLKTSVLYLILAAELVLCGCGKGEGEGGREAPPLDPLEQTIWKGMLTDSNGAVIYLSVAFSYEADGYYLIKGDCRGFRYHNYNGKND